MVDIASTATSIYSAKGAFFDRLLELQAGGGFLMPDGSNITIAYDEPPNDATLTCIYGGGARGTHLDMLDNFGLMVSEDSAFSIYLRVIDRPATSVRITDTRAALLATQIAHVMTEQPNFAGHVWKGIGRFQGDYVNTDDETMTILALEIKVSSIISYR